MSSLYCIGNAFLVRSCRITEGLEVPTIAGGMYLAE